MASLSLKFKVHFLQINFQKTETIDLNTVKNNGVRLRLHKGHFHRRNVET